MDKEMLDKAEEALKVVADKLGVATTEFWPAFIRKQILDCVTTVIWCAIWLGITAIYAKGFLAWPDTPNIGPYDVDLAKWFMRGVGVIMCIGALFNVAGVIDQIKYVFNAKYWALRDVVNTFGLRIKK